MGRLAGRVALAQERGEVAEDADADRVARNLFSIYYGEVTMWLALGAPPGEGEVPEASLRRAFELQMRGLLARRDERGPAHGGPGEEER